MRIQRATPVNDLLARVIFLLAPTLLVSYFLLWNANKFYSVLRQQTMQQTTYIGLGMLCSALIYGFRFRFLPIFVALCAILYSVYRGIDATAVGEFDTFFLSIQFLVFAITFVLGWLIAWGFVRLRFFSIFIAALFLSLSILLISRSNELFFAQTEKNGLYQFTAIVAPVVLYAVYIIFTAELIRNYKDKSQGFWWFVSRRVLVFVVLAAMLFGGVVYFNREEIKDTMAEFGGGGKEGDNSMLKRNKDNTFDLQQYTQLRSNLGRSNELLFAAHIDNFFPNSDFPNPLYLTAFYYSRFDTMTETFERDKKIPFNDLYEPDPSTVPMFFPKYDSSVLKQALTEKFRKTVEIEVYKKQLSAQTFVAPSTSFFVQPISIERDFRSEFSSAYRAKSYISELNSAYFVYNAADDPQIERFQEQRFQELRNVKDYEGVPAPLMQYYTNMPADVKFNKIKELAQVIGRGKTTPIDRVIAVRDYFLSKDENGDPLFSYTDNPGVPDIPDASKLQYFLFENRKGYCAYYAGATLFLLRSLGIPSRITVGFMTVDRSDKNKGWYWYYADQAHAWVQVYFPGYGWLDFDTTVGNDDAQQSPTPDGTPPMQPPKAYLAGDGIVNEVDTAKKTASIKMNRMVYHDKEYKFDQPVDLTLDLGIASIVKDSTDVPLSEMRTGDSVTAVSYAEAFRQLNAASSEQAQQLVNRFPKPAPIDEVYLRKQKNKTDEKNQNTLAKKEEAGWKQVLICVGATLLALLLLLVLLPRIIFNYYRIRRSLAKKVGSKSYWTYRASGFYLHQLGYFKAGQTALKFAQETDKKLLTNFGTFMIAYLKLKYANQQLNPQEEKMVAEFLPAFIKQVNGKLSFNFRFKQFFRIFRAISFFGKEEI